jgi:hypothetical protein
MNQVLVAVLATVISVTDGDTIKVKAQLWPQMITKKALLALRKPLPSGMGQLRLRRKRKPLNVR